MPTDYLHTHKQFPELIRIVAEQRGNDPALVEKDYWIMHSLYGLQKLALTFELKGGTSLSKGFKFIDRFSEDIDIHIDPPADRNVKTGRNQDKPAHIKSRKDGDLEVDHQSKPARVNSHLRAAQKRNGLTETDVAPSVVRSTLNSISFCAVVSATVTDNDPLQVTARVALFLDPTRIVSSKA